jgi:hypothetical protein
LLWFHHWYDIRNHQASRMQYLSGNYHGLEVLLMLEVIINEASCEDLMIHGIK